MDAKKKNEVNWRIVLERQLSFLFLCERTRQQKVEKLEMLAIWIVHVAQTGSERM